MRQIIVKIWPRQSNGIWRVEIDGERFESATFMGIQDAVQRALAEHKQAIEEEGKRVQ